MHCLAIVYCPSLSNFPPLTYKDWLACQQTRSSCSTPPLAPVTDQKKPAVWAATPREAGWISFFIIKTFRIERKGCNNVQHAFNFGFNFHQLSNCRSKWRFPRPCRTWWGWLSMRTSALRCCLCGFCLGLENWTGDPDILVIFGPWFASKRFHRWTMMEDDGRSAAAVDLLKGESCFPMETVDPVGRSNWAPRLGISARFNLSFDERVRAALVESGIIKLLARCCQMTWSWMSWSHGLVGWWTPNW